MYKTVRHGENSLQYTILPQNDDFRMDCKLSSAESSCSNSTNKSRKLKSKRPRRRTFFAYLGLIFICTVIVGAVLIPFLVSAECLPNPTDWFLKSKAAFMHNNNIQRFEYNSNNKNNHYNNKNNTINITATHDDVNVENLGKYVQIINKTNNNESTKNVINVLSTATTSADLMSSDNKNLVTEVHLLDNDVTVTTVTNDNDEKLANYVPSHINVAIVLTTTIRSPLIDNNHDKIIQAPAPALPAQSAMQLQQQQQPQLINNNNINMPQINAFVNSPHAPAAPQQVIASNVQQNQQTQAAPPTITTRIIQVPLLKSTAKKPFIPPVLVKSKSYYDLAQHNLDANINKTNNNNKNNIEKNAIKATEALGVVVQHTNNNYNNNNKWLKANWPYMDPNTYFQWTGYKTEDSVLLPAILGLVLLVVILIMVLLLMAGVKRRLVSVVKKRKRNDIEEAGAEDNATLLTTTNLSDED